MNMKRSITVAQVGVGYWGPNLLRNFVSHKAFEVASVVEVDEERRNYVHSLYPKIKVTAQYDEVLADRKIDAIVIATPVATHFRLAEQALLAGKHVLVEKPMAKTVTEIERLATLAGQNNCVAMVGHTFLYNPAVRYLKRLITSGELGKIRYIYSQRLNLGRIRSDVDALWNFGPHDISIIQYLLEDPTPLQVTKHGMSYVQEGINDVVIVNLIYPEKIMANIHLSWLDPNKTRAMTVVGSQKMVVYDDTAENKITIYDKGIDRMAVLGENMDYDKASYVKFNHRSGDILLPRIPFEEPLKLQIDHFAACIVEGMPCLTGTAHAKKVIEILSRADQS